MKNYNKIIVKDTEDFKNIIIQVNLKNNTTSVLSTFSAWENLALLIEGLAVTAQECAKQGISRKKVKKAIDDYLAQAMPTY